MPRLELEHQQTGRSMPPHPMPVSRYFQRQQPWKPMTWEQRACYEQERSQRAMNYHWGRAGQELEQEKQSASSEREWTRREAGLWR